MAPEFPVWTQEKSKNIIGPVQSSKGDLKTILEQCKIVKDEEEQVTPHWQPAGEMIQKLLTDGAGWHQTKGLLVKSKTKAQNRCDIFKNR